MQAHRRPATCSTRQAGAPTSRPPSGKANTNNSQRVWRRAQGQPGSQQLLAGPPCRHAGRERSAVQTVSEVHRQLGSASVPWGTWLASPGVVSAPGLHQGVPNAAALGGAAPCPGGPHAVATSQEGPVSLPLLGTPAPMSRGGGPAGASREPGGNPHRTFGSSRGSRRSLQDQPVTATGPHPARAAPVMGQGEAVLALGYVVPLS